MIIISDRVYTDQKMLENIFGHLLEDFNNITPTEFDACIDHARLNNWESWETGFTEWKTLGYIPVVSEMEFT